MRRVKQQMRLHGHVSAKQEDHIGDPMYTLTRTMVRAKPCAPGSLLLPMLMHDAASAPPAARQ